jgi:ion channel POLLUX/CASTOR
MTRRRRRERLRYRFDNTLSRGTPALVAWLALASLVLLVVVTAALAVAEPKGEDNPFLLLWQSFIATFGIDAPDTGSAAVLGLWFVLGIGGIFVVSALVGLLTSGLNNALEQLRKGRSAVFEADHTVILGWSDQVFTVVGEIVQANASRRRAAIVILAEQDKVDMEDQLRERVGATGRTRLVCRTGSPLDVADLALVNPNGARSIIVLAPAGGSAQDADAYVLKALLAINRGPAFQGFRHHVVAAVRDGRNKAVAQLAGGSAVVIDSDEIVARLVVQTARHSGLSAVYQDLLDFGGNEFYLASAPALGLTGRTFGEVLLAFDTGCPVGLVDPTGRAVLNPPDERVIAAEDRLVLLAEDDSSLGALTSPGDASEPVHLDETAIVAPSPPEALPERTLILGWNGRAAQIIEQLDTYIAPDSTVDIVTDRPDVYPTVNDLSIRLTRLAAPGVKDGDTRDRAVLDQLDIELYDNLVVLCDDRDDPLTADSRVLMTLLHLRDILRERGMTTSIVSEMRDDRDRVLAQLTRADDFVVSEHLVSLLMAQISESPHLEAVFADLFDAAGAEIYIRPATAYLRAERLVRPGLTFATAVEAARRRGEVAIGYRIAGAVEGHGVVLNPDKRSPMPRIDRLIVLAQN